jgi:hypothetical protein
MRAVALERPGLAFWQVFRNAAWSNVEYSFDADRTRHTTMVRGAEGFFPQVEAFASSVEFAGDFTWSVARFVDAVAPDSYLLRADWRSTECDALSLYCRYRRVPDEASFNSALALAWPMRWTGPAPHVVAAALGVDGPRGLGFRVDDRGRHRVALYFKVDRFVGDFDSASLDHVTAAVGFSSAVAESIRTDLRDLFVSGPVGVIGVDPGGAEGVAGGLKLNPSNISVDRALAFLTAKGADSHRIAEIREIARALRAASLSYLGIRYDASGFAGWRTYMSVVPRQYRSPGMPQVLAADNPLPTLRLPHY